MSRTLDALVGEALATGTIAGLPDGHFIDGRLVPSQSGAGMESWDPGRGAVFAAFAAGEAADVDAAVDAARRALKGRWRDLRPAERGRILQRAAALIRENAARLAVAESLDSGKRLSEALGDVAGAARCFDYYAGACDKLQGDTMPLGRDHLGMTVHEPVGVAAQIIPWNYPISTAARGLAPALAAGCAVVAKPAEQTPFTALMLAALLDEAGLPDGVCNVVTGTGRAAGAPLVAHPGVDHVTFTGSVATGIGVMQAAAPNVTQVVLELGGKSPVLVFGDCDVESALSGVMEAIYENAGQICSAGSRLVIERGLRDAFLARLVERVERLTLGHGLTNPGMGPVSSAAHLARIDGMVSAAVGRGARLHAGGFVVERPDLGRGWFYAPTIVEPAAGSDAIVQDEVFGPVLAVQTFDTEEEALALANGTPYGLVAGVYTGDFGRAHRLARDIDAGQIYINEYFAGGIEMPFGGNRLSGFGREKGLEGLRSYSRVKSIAARIARPA
ncbi:aldehyde dehydrogenase family protein [Labrys wisconsinensis]|uniref:Acyl-CoA reductase-like NAD-dependent aldehyde dehydrogenase n=1 Tax=Labrys wisconsinensis TaxID=425677 RepID=A0ABU0J565_9HYPH|nr:aldehyde dehydrogenase family protein [Labrys wisconsinensis]MDQ0468598.1 acyl-CoA reductase-like NAD-dependent aldehyde dehydrogenase [Labrys wisconsinensis]